MSAARWSSRLCRRLLLASLFAGLFVMHGVQATPSPVQASGAMVDSMATSHVAPDHQHVVIGAMPVAEHPLSVSSPHSLDGHSDHAHPGGAVCFALLVLAGLILLLAGGYTRRHLMRPTGQPLLLVRRGPPRARPPSVYQLSVLRL